MSIEGFNPIITNAYVVVESDESHESPLVEPEFRPTTSRISATKEPANATTRSIDVDETCHIREARRRTPHPAYANIPEARDLAWNDDFFDEEYYEGEICAVFDLDYENMISYHASVNWTYFASTLLVPYVFVFLVFAGAPCFLKRYAAWKARSQHVAITRDGIRFVEDRHPTCWGLSCTDSGKRSKTIPFDKITDCDVTEPAGNTCLCIRNTLTTVHIDTASSPNGSNGLLHELTISGLKDPYGFKKLVWAMKRANQNGTIGMISPNVMVRSHGEVDHDDIANATIEMIAMQTSSEKQDNAADIMTLLREIRDELRLRPHESYHPHPSRHEQPEIMTATDTMLV